MNEPTPSAEPSGIPNLTGLREAQAKAEAAAIAASDLLTKLSLSPGERHLALHTLLMLELVNDARDFPQYLKNLDITYSLIRHHAEATRPAIEAAIEDRLSRAAAAG